MAGRDFGERNQMQTVERLACGDWLEGDHNVVRASELEGLVSQNRCINSGLFRYVRANLNSGTTTLYSKCTTIG